MSIRKSNYHPIPTFPREIALGAIRRTIVFSGIYDVDGAVRIASYDPCLDRGDLGCAHGMVDRFGIWIEMNFAIWKRTTEEIVSLGVVLAFRQGFEELMKR